MEELDPSKKARNSGARLSAATDDDEENTEKTQNGSVGISLGITQPTQRERTDQ